MKWTKEKPNKEGWYWLRLGQTGYKTIRLVRQADKTFYVARMLNSDGWKPVGEVNCLWAGPIEEPEE